MFQRSVLPASSGRPHTSLHGATGKKRAIFGMVLYLRVGSVCQVTVKPQPASGRDWVFPRLYRLWGSDTPVLWSAA
jgi:hypothetical protein